MRKSITVTCNGMFCSSNVRNIFWNGVQAFTILLISILMDMTGSVYAFPKVTLEKLVDENRLISAPVELHLTSVDAAMTNSTVSLNHEDAWLFFDNIKPSAVIEKYTSKVFINGEFLQIGGNGHVAIYVHGTAIMPHASKFKPLTVYAEENFGGTSNQLAINTYHNNLGELDNSIRSFKLKRDYMATFANNVNGSGYSRVFTADTDNLEYSVMPEELYGSVSFIRVFKYEWVTKKGKTG